MSKEKLINELTEAHTSLWNAALSKPTEMANHQINGKWSVAENVEHINKGLAAFGQFMKAPKDVLKEKFGLSEGVSRSRGEVITIYEAALKKGAQSTAKYVPEPEKQFDLKELIDAGNQNLDSLISSVNAWEEEELDLYLCPHPLLGMLTAREMCYFTAFHARHHKDSIELIQ